MNQAIRFQLGIVTIIVIYYLIRLLGVSDHSFNLWQQIYWGNFIRNSFLLFFTFLLFYQIFNHTRKMSITGPTIIKGKILKRVLILNFTLGWLAVVTHTIFDSLKLILPLELLPLYQFADLMDETIAHLFMFIPVYISFLLLTILEVQRPSPNLSKKDLVLITILGLFSGLLWGPNLSEGNHSIFTSFPILITYLFLAIYILIRHKLKLTNRPWTLFSLISAASVIISFSAWSLLYSSSTQLFTIIK